ncbi:outer dense fiber protein 3-like [Anneissia japonica]|uniref:outer dense fiber protein 3-like n=1 Tax=Anneissia japonica TaxID=1529436 RepID=UPI001425B37D|nr:outer dense fiber protein 3-like [Anneissia japonica]
MTEEKDKPTAIIAARERGPGPGRYKLPSSCGYLHHDFSKHMKPSYSFGKRLENSMFKKDNSPGPAYFINPTVTRHGQDGTPAYSILGRQRDPNSFVTPSPYAYSPEKCHPQGERHAPVHSMGARTRYRKRDQCPAANNYSLPSLHGSKVPNKKSSSSYSMTARSKVGGYLEDLAKTPGPGRYHAINPNIVHVKKPSYSMLGRHDGVGDSTQKPGPGAHSPEKVYVNKRKYPSHSLGIRHSEFVCPLIIDVTD